MNKKIRLIFLPYLLLVIAFTIVYSFLNWLLFMRTQTFSIREDIPNLWLPIILPWILIYIWLRPRIRLLNLASKSGNRQAWFYIIAGFGIAVPALVAQEYLTTATGKLTMMYKVANLAGQPPTKYYKFEQHATDKGHAGAWSRVYVSGKYNSDYNMDIYLMFPLVSEPRDTTITPVSHWIGYRYHKRIGNHGSREYKRQAFQDFWKESMDDFDGRDYNRFVYLERVGNTVDRPHYEAAMRRSPRFGYGNNTLFLGIDEPFEDRNGNKLAWIFGATGIFAALWLLMLSFAKFNGSALIRFERKHPPEPGDEEGEAPTRRLSNARPGELGLKDYLIYFVPKKGFLITPLLIDLNFLVFILLVCAGAGFIDIDTRVLLDWGGNYRPYTTDGQWWRLLTSMFLHGGIMHLLANMIGLIFVGIFLEPILGAKRYAIAYLVTGLAGSVVSLWLHDATVSIGASGAIFGLFGIFLALLLGKVFPPAFSKGMLMSTLIFIGYNLVIGMSGGVDNAAHMGGLVSGMILGWVMMPGVRREREEKDPATEGSHSP